jgi:hypothetical protein
VAKKIWINNEKLKESLFTFFDGQRGNISNFGNTVNQTFEAFVFASLINHYKAKGWNVILKNLTENNNKVKLKFNTRGKPGGYTYALCTNGDQSIQIRHGLRVATHFNRQEFEHSANIVLDVSVIKDVDLSEYESNDALPNESLITFGEAKHMSAFAELIANFIGLAHEIAPDVLANIRSPNPSNSVKYAQSDHPAPFLYVSGYLYPTAQGLLESIRDRGYSIDVYDYQTEIRFGLTLPTMPAPSN